MKFYFWQWFVKSFADDVNCKIVCMCKGDTFSYVNDGGISNIHLFYDGLYWLGSGIFMLADSFVFKLNYLLQTHLHYPNIHFQLKE